MHNIEYFTYDENIKRDWVQSELDHYAACEGYLEGCKGLSGKIRWLDTLDIFADYDSAQKAIEAQDKGWYDQLAVRYYEPKRGFTNKRLEELRKKEIDALDAYHQKDGVWAKTLKAEYIGCKTCGSKLKRKLIQTNRCPVCHNDLRPDSVLARVNAAEYRWKKAQATCNSYILDHAQKVVKWLVKIEYHT